MPFSYVSEVSISHTDIFRCFHEEREREKEREREGERGGGGKRKRVRRGLPYPNPNIRKFSKLLRLLVLTCDFLSELAYDGDHKRAVGTVGKSAIYRMSQGDRAREEPLARRQCDRDRGTSIALRRYGGPLLSFPL